MKSVLFISISLDAVYIAPPYVVLLSESAVFSAKSELLITGFLLARFDAIYNAPPSPEELSDFTEFFSKTELSINCAFV